MLQTNSTVDNLPSWSLNDLYNDITDPKIANDIDYCRKEAQRLASSFEGKIASSTAADLAAMISSYEALSDVIGKLLSHAVT